MCDHPRESRDDRRCTVVTPTGTTDLVGASERREAQLSDLAIEIQVERAAALGVAGRRLEESLARLDRARRDGLAAAEVEELVYDTAMDLWSLMLQRESYGAHGNSVDRLAEEYGVPREVVARVGIVRPRTPRVSQ